MTTTAAFFLVVAYVLFGLATLTAFPLVWEDEAWYTQSAWAFLEDGAFTLPMFADLGGFDQENVVYGRTYLGAMAVAFELGGLSPYAARLVSLLSGFVAIAAVFAIGRELWSLKVGAIAALFMAITPNFVLQSHDARPELMLVAAWTTAFYLAISGDRGASPWRLFLAGLLASLAADIHFNGLAVPIALFLVLLVRRASLLRLAFFGMGVVLGGLWWVYIHVLPDPSLLREQGDAFSVGLPILDVLGRPLSVLVLEIARYVLVEPPTALIILALAAVATIVLLARRRDAALLALLTYAVTIHVFMTLLAGTKVPFYAVLLLPVAALLVARLVDVSPRPAAWAVSAGLVIVSLATVGSIVVDQSRADYDRYVSRLREAVPTGATIQGQPTIWFGFSDHPFIASHYFQWAGPYDEEIRRLGIQYVIGERITMIPGCRDCRDVVPEEMRRFLDGHAELVAEVTDPYYGREEAMRDGEFVTRIFRIKDEAGQAAIPGAMTEP